VNTGSRPIGVSSLGLNLSDGRYIPVIEPLLTTGSVRLPAVLQPQQSATVWLAHDPLRARLARRGLILLAPVALFQCSRAAACGRFLQPGAARDRKQRDHGDQECRDPDQQRGRQGRLLSFGKRRARR